MHVLCYRVEHKYHGHGPYVRSSFHPNDTTALVMRRRLFDSINWDKHPTPNKTLKPSEFCGFESLESLANWFGDFAHDLHNAGYEIKVFLINKKWIRKDNQQILFKRYKAKRYCTLSMLEVA